MKLFTLLALLLSSQAFAALTIGTYNIRNFDYDERARIHTDKPQLEVILKSLNFDLLGVNEINNTAEFESFVSTKLPTHDVHLSTCGGAHGQKLGFVFNKSKLRLISFNEDLEITDPGGTPACYGGSRPLVIGKFQEIATGDTFIALQVHLKSGGNADSLKKRFMQYDIIEKYIKKLRANGETRIVTSGDFNSTSYTEKGEEYKRFTSMVKNAGMVDLSADLACSAYWWGGSDDGIESPSLLDHVMASPEFIKNRSAQSQAWTHCKQVSCKDASLAQLGISYASVSDHCPQTVTPR
ncbi:MAG: hypothetical protein K2P81_15395 [Bacteriovoracaceae bacterium]|nr:hypothetical protein [Bacteriovoracaceae bacterium]